MPNYKHRTGFTTLYERHSETPCPHGRHFTFRIERDNKTNGLCVTDSVCVDCLAVAFAGMEVAPADGPVMTNQKLNAHGGGI